MDETMLVQRRQAESRLRQKAIAHTGRSSERRPIARRQANEPLLHHGRSAADIEHFQSPGQMRVGQRESGEALTIFVRQDGVERGIFIQVPHERFLTAARIEDSVNRLVRCLPQAVDDAERPEHEPSGGAGVEQCELVGSDGAAGDENLP